MRPPSFLALLLTISHLILFAVLISWFLSTPANYAKNSLADFFESNEPSLQKILAEAQNRTLITFFFLSGGHLIPHLQAYCVISACKYHPNSIIIVFKRPWMKKSQNWVKIPNLAVIDLNESFILENTPLMSWFSHDWSHSQLYEYHLGDALRLAFLYKFGGVYLDTDVLILKSLDDLPWDSMAFEDKASRIIDGAVMKFRPGHPFLELAMKKFVDEFEDKWAHQGPALLTRTAMEYGDRLPEITILPYFYFYPLSWRNLEIRALFKKANRTEAEKLIKKAYAIHLWNKATKRYSIEKGSFLESIIERISEI